MDRAILEIGGTALVAATAFAATKFLVIAPFDRQYTAQQNSLIFVFVPTGIYVVFRIYFALSFYMCSKIRFPWIAKLFAFLLVIGAMSGAVFTPPVKEIALTAYVTVLGDLPSILWKQFEPDFDKTVKFGYRLFALLSGWFIALFVVENMLKLILWLIGSIYRLTVYRLLSQHVGATEAKCAPDSQDEVVTTTHPVLANIPVDAKQKVALQAHSNVNATLLT